MLYNNANNTPDTHTHTHTHTNIPTPTPTNTLDEGTGMAVKKSLEIDTEQVLLEGGCKRGGRIRVADFKRVPATEFFC